jgi:hypothetical protein
VNTLIDNAVVLDATNNLHTRRSDAVPTMMILAGSDDWLSGRRLQAKTNRFQRIYDSENSSSQILTLRVIYHALSALFRYIWQVTNSLIANVHLSQASRPHIMLNIVRKLGCTMWQSQCTTNTYSSAELEVKTPTSRCAQCIRTGFSHSEICSYVHIIPFHCFLPLIRRV